MATVCKLKNPISKIIWMKYLKGGSLRNLKTANTPTGTTIWNLCRRGIDKFQQQLYKIPGNGKRIFLWDKILGNSPLSTVFSLTEIKLWMINQGLLRVANICIWDSAGNWVGWTFPEIPVHLLSQHKLLISFLFGLAPIHCSSKDQWGWGQIGFYSAAQGFSVLQTPYVSCLSPACWKFVWYPYILP